MPSSMASDRQVLLLNLGTKQTQVPTKGTGEPIASLAMDRSTGTLAVGNMNGIVVSGDATGAVAQFGKYARPARQRVAPDNALCCLTKLGCVAHANTGWVFLVATARLWLAHIHAEKICSRSARLLRDSNCRGGW